MRERILNPKLVAFLKKLEAYWSKFSQEGNVSVK